LIENNTNVSVSHVETYVNEDKTNKDYGVIQGVNLTIIKNKEPDSKITAIVPIKPVEINTAHSKKQNKVEGHEEDELEKNIKKLLINFYNLSGDNINITVQKK